MFNIWIHFVREKQWNPNVYLEKKIKKIRS